MTITIRIECETIHNLLQHLTVLKDDIKKEAKTRKLDRMEEEFPDDVELSDSNCYGDHILQVEYEN